MIASRPHKTVRPTISVVIPTYQRGEVVESAIQSVLSQSELPQEIIVVDDGSTDDTRMRVAAFDGPVRYVYKPNAGASAARNLGVTLATGEWLAFLDSDDVWRPDHLSEMATAIERTDGRCDYYFSDAVFAGRSNSASWFEFCNFDPKSPFEAFEPGIDVAMMPYQPMLIPCAVVRRSAWIDVGGMREDLITREDTHLFFVLSIAGAACAIRAIGVDISDNVGDAQRLTRKHDATSVVYHRASVDLYTDVIGRPGIPVHYGSELRSRLSDGYWNLAKANLASKKSRNATRAAWNSIACEPASVTRRLRDASRRFR